MSEQSRIIIRNIDDYQFDPYILSTTIDKGIWGTKEASNDEKRQEGKQFQHLSEIYFEKHK